MTVPTLFTLATGEGHPLSRKRHTRRSDSAAVAPPGKGRGSGVWRPSPLGPRPSWAEICSFHLSGVVGGRGQREAAFCYPPKLSRQARAGGVLLMRRWPTA